MIVLLIWNSIITAFVIASILISVRVIRHIKTILMLLEKTVDVLTHTTNNVQKILSIWKIE